MFKIFSKIKKETKELKEKTEELKTEIKEEPKSIRAVIEGRLYDTSKAEKICEYFVENDSLAVCGMACGFVEAILYRTENDRFFIEQYGRLFECGDKLAQRILSDNPEKYQEIFGKVEDA